MLGPLGNRRFTREEKGKWVEHVGTSKEAMKKKSPGRVELGGPSKRSKMKKSLRVKQF